MVPPEEGQGALVGIGKSAVRSDELDFRAGGRGSDVAEHNIHGRLVVLRRLGSDLVQLADELLENLLRSELLVRPRLESFLGLLTESQPPVDGTG